MDSRFVKAQRYLLTALIFFVVLAIFPFTPSPAVEIKVLGYELCAFAAVILWLLAPRIEKAAAQRSSALLGLCGVFLVLTLTAAWLSINAGYSLHREFTKWAALFILFVVAAEAFHTPKQVWGLVGALCIAVSIASLYAFVQFMGKDPFPWVDAHSYVNQGPSTFGNPNVASHVLVLVTVLACGLAFQRKGRWAFLCLLLFMGHFALTETRGSLVALSGGAALIIVVAITSRWVKKPSRAIALTLGSMLLLGLIGLAGIAALSNAKSGQPYPEDESVMLRYQSFYGATRLIQDEPWLGHGPGMYEVVSPKYWTTAEKRQLTQLNRMSYRVHNEPLEIAVEAGLPAGLVYLAILIMGVYYGLCLWFGPGASERRRLGLSLAAFFFVFLLDGLFGFNVHVPASAALLFVFAGATAGLWREREVPSERRPFQAGWRSVPWRLAVLGCALFLPVFAVRDFAAQFWQQRGLGAMSYKAYPAAAECFQKAASLAPYDWLNPYYLGVTAMQMDNAPEAAKLFVRTLDLNPNYINAQFKVAEALFNVAAKSKGTADAPELRAVVDYAQRAAELNPLSPEVHDLLGRATLLRAQRLAAAGPSGSPAVQQAWQAAEEHLQHAIDCNVKDKYAQYNVLALARLGRGDARGAQKALVQSLEEKPDELKTWQLFLQVSQKTGQYDTLRTCLDRRIENLNRAETVSEELGALNLMRARVLYTGYADEAAAEDALRVAVDTHPESADAWAAFHAFAKATGRLEGFNASLTQAAVNLEKTKESLAPQVRAVVLGLGPGEDSVIAGVSALMDALQQHQAAAQGAAKTAELFSWAADVLAARAKREFLSPENAGEIFFRLGLAYGACHDFNAAAELLGTAAGTLTGPQLQQCLLRRGAALVQSGNTAAAIQAYEQAVANDSTSIDARYSLAQALAQDGQRDRARQEYQTILNTFEVGEEGRKALQQALDALGQ